MTFDSCILIDQLNDHPAAARVIAEARPRLLSVIARAEVLAGARTSGQFDQALRLLSIFDLVDVDIEIADGVAAIRRRSRGKLPDALILATAEHLHMPLVTRDGHFPPSRVEVIIPYRLG